uniref:Kinesin motor domain-containing protein n=1 Tax=viral metagenome TaxID=1070528 RepID=A0A6C0C8A2_9ZZZZ
MKTKYAFIVKQVGGANGLTRIFTESQKNFKDEVFDPVTYPTEDIYPDSHYNTDYILNQFASFVQKMSENASIWDNRNFVTFVDRLEKLKSKVENARTMDPIPNPYEYVGVDPSDELYQHGMDNKHGGIYENRKYLARPTNLQFYEYWKIGSNVPHSVRIINNWPIIFPVWSNGQFNSPPAFILPPRGPADKVSYGARQTFEIDLPPSTKYYDFYFQPFKNDSSGSNVPEKLAEEIDQLNNLYFIIIRSLVAQDRNEEIIDTNTKITKSFVKVNSEIAMSQYTDKYNALEAIVVNIFEAIKHSKQSVMTKINILDSVPDIAKYYANLRFSNSDIADAVKTPTDMIDFISQTDFDKKIKKKVAEISKPSLDIINSALHLKKYVPRVTSTRGSFGENIAELYNYIGKAKTLPATDFVNNMFVTKIQTDNVGKIIAKFWNNDDMSERGRDIMIKTRDHARLISGDPDFNRGLLSGKARMQNYRNKYPYKNNLIGGSNKYGFAKKKSLAYVSQTGGFYISYDDIFNDSKQRRTKVEQGAARISGLAEQINKPKIETNLDVLYQNNDFLANALNNHVFHRMFVAENANVQSSLGDKLINLIDEFQNDLSKLFGVMNDRVKTVANNKVLHDLFASGSVKLNDFIDFFKESGITSVTPVRYPYDYGMDNMYLINLITDMKNQSVDMDVIASIMKKLSTKGISDIDRSKKITELSDDLHVLNDKLQDLRNNMISVKGSLNHNVSDLQQNKSYTNKVIVKNFDSLTSNIDFILGDINDFESISDLLIEFQKLDASTTNSWEKNKQLLRVLNDKIKAATPVKDKLDAYVALPPDPKIYKETDLGSYVLKYNNLIDNVIMYQNNLGINYETDKSILKMDKELADLGASVEKLKILSLIIFGDKINWGGVLIKSDVGHAIDTANTVQIIDNIREMVKNLTVDNDLSFDKLPIRFDMTRGKKLTKKEMFYDILTVMGNLFLFPELLEEIDIPHDMRLIIDTYAYPTDIWPIFMNNILHLVDNDKLIDKNVEQRFNKLFNIFKGVINEHDGVTNEHDKRVSELNAFPEYVSWDDPIIENMYDKLFYYASMGPESKITDTVLNNIDLTSLQKMRNLQTQSDISDYIVGQRNIIIISLLSLLSSSLSSVYTKLMIASVGKADNVAIKELSNKIAKDHVRLERLEIMNKYSKRVFRSNYMREYIINIDTYLNSPLHSIPIPTPANLIDISNLDNNMITMTMDIKNKFGVFKKQTLSYLNLIMSENDTGLPPCIADNADFTIIFKTNMLHNLYSLRWEKLGGGIKTVAKGVNDIVKSRRIDFASVPNHIKKKIYNEKIEIYPVGNKITDDIVQQYVSYVNTIDLALTILPLILQAKTIIEKYDYTTLGAVRWAKNAQLLKEVLMLLSDIDRTIRFEKDVLLIREILAPEFDFYDKTSAILNFPFSKANILDAFEDLTNMISMYHSYIINLIKILGLREGVIRIREITSKCVDPNNIDKRNKLLNLSDFVNPINNLEKYVTNILNDNQNIVTTAQRTYDDHKLDDATLLDLENDYFYSNGNKKTAKDFRYFVLTKNKEILDKFIELDKTYDQLFDYHVKTKDFLSPILLKQIIDKSVAGYGVVLDKSDNDLRRLFTGMVDDMTGPGGIFFLSPGILQPADLRSALTSDLEKIIIGKKFPVIGGVSIYSPAYPPSSTYIVIDNNGVIDKVKIINAIDISSGSPFFWEESIKGIAFALNYNFTDSIAYYKQLARAILSYMYASINRNKEFERAYVPFYSKIKTLTDGLPHQKFLEEFRPLVDRITNENTYIQNTAVLIPIITIPMPGTIIPDTQIDIYKYNDAELSTNPSISSHLKLAESAFKNLVDIVDTKKMNDLLKNEKIVGNLIISNKSTLQMILNKQDNIMEENSAKFEEVVNVIRQVMFNSYYKATDFVPLSTLTMFLGKMTEYYTRSRKNLDNNLKNMIDMHEEFASFKKQETNYLLFLAGLDQKINSSEYDPKIYLRIGFGLIGYYNDIINGIIACVEKKSVDEMTEIEKYLFDYHWIPLMRCRTLFNWLINTYAQEEMTSEVAKLGRGETIDHIFMSKKIELNSVSGAIKQIFTEFNAIRQYIDQYHATLIPTLSIHMRINDYETKSGGAITNYSPFDPAYVANRDNRVFSGHGNRLHVNFDKVKDDQYPGGINSVDAEMQFNFVNNEMKHSDNVPKENYGVLFNKIYDSENFPDPAIISNYMSLATKILQGEGTMLMTYGYSGAGKTFPLFGNSERNEQGILQATLQSFHKRIYFRAYEIYGLGTRFNSYWNRQHCSNNAGCPFITCEIGEYIYHMIIHHHLEKNNDDIVLKNSIQIENQHDMLAYIMEMVDPTKNTFKFQTGMTAKNAGPNLFSAVDHTGQVTIPLFVEIGEKQINNFDKMVQKINESRINGITNQYLDRQTFHQIKATSNNPESSRSVMVYEFQIEVNMGDKNIFVPFIIYDMPGKEDLVKTYVTPNRDDISIKTAINDHPNKNIKHAIFKDLADDDNYNADFGDLIKDHKISLIMNPYLIPTYCSSVQIFNIVKYLKSLDTVISNGWRSTFFAQLFKLDAIFYGVQIDSSDKVLRTNADVTIGSTPTQSTLSTFEIFNSIIITFTDFFDESKINFQGSFPNKGAMTSADPLFNKNIKENLGILESQPGATLTASTVAIKRYLLTLLIWELMQYRALDIIARIIELSVDGNSDNGWETENIHAAFEGFYINETVNGLINFLTIKVLNRPSPYESQVDGSLIAPTSFMREISSTIPIQNYYCYIRNLYDADKTSKFTLKDDPIKLVANPNLTKKIENNAKRIEIENFVAKYHSLVGMQNDSSIDIFDKTVTKLLSAFRSAIYYDSFLYDSNKIFRNNQGGVVVCTGSIGEIIDVDSKLKYIDPTIYDSGATPSTVQGNEDPATPAILDETNRPLIQDFLEPYKQKVTCWHLFYVITNNDPEKKGTAQIEMLENSMKFINILNSLSTSTCTI